MWGTYPGADPGGGGSWPPLLSTTNLFFSTNFLTIAKFINPRPPRRRRRQRRTLYTAVVAPPPPLQKILDPCLGPISLRQYELVYLILARKQEFLVNFQALSHRNLRGIWTRKFPSRLVKRAPDTSRQLTPSPHTTGSTEPFWCLPLWPYVWSSVKWGLYSI